MSDLMVIDSNRASLDFKLSDGSEWSIPLMSSLGVREARALARKFREGADGGDTDTVDAFIDFLDEKCPGLVDAVPMGTLIEITKAWNAAEAARGGSVGES